MRSRTFRRAVNVAALCSATLFASAAGAQSLVPGPGDPNHDSALLQKMDGYERQVHGILSLPLGWGLEGFVPPSQRSVVETFISSGQSDFKAATGKHPYEVLSDYGEYGDLGMFGGLQAAGDAFHYMVLRDSGAPAAEVDAARKELLRVMQGLHWYHQITGVPGVVVRGLRRITPEAGEPPLPGAAPQTVPLFDGSGKPQPAKKEPTWRADQSGQLPFLIWLDDTSKDQIDGYVFALGAVYDAAKDDPSIPSSALQPLIDDARAIGHKLLEKHEFIGKETDLVLVDADGRPTTFHDLSAEEISAGFVLDTPVNGFNALMSLGMMRTFYHMTGDEKIGRFYYEEMIGKRNYLQVAEDSVNLMYVKEQTNFSNVNMAFVAAYGVLRYETDTALAAHVRRVLEDKLYAPGVSRQAKGLKQSFFDFIYAGFRTEGSKGPGAQAMTDGLETLSELRNAPYWDDAVENCDAAEIAALACKGIDGTPIALSKNPGRGGSLVATAPLPMRIRPPSNFEWRSDPHVVNGGGGTRLNPGAELLTAYWLGRLLRAGDLGVGNISPHARLKPAGWGGSGGAGGAGGAGGNGGANAAAGESDSGCGCRTATGNGSSLAYLSALLLLAAGLRRRRALPTTKVCASLVFAFLAGCGSSDDSAGGAATDAASEGAAGGGGAPADGGSLDGSAQKDAATDASFDGGADAAGKPLEQCGLRGDKDVIDTPKVGEPGYLNPFTDPTFGTSVTRVTGDPGSAMGSLGQKWADVARHGYSKRQPWNADESLLYLDREVGVFLDGHSFAPKMLAKAPTSMNESRWHPTRPEIRVFAGDNVVGEWDVLANTTKVVATFPGYKDLHIGPWEGNLSTDGNQIALYGLNPSGKAVAFAYDMAKKAKDPDIPLDGVPVDWVSISPLGTYVVVNGWNDETQVYTRLGTPVGTRWSAYGRPSHYDLAVDGNGDEVAVGVSKSDPDDGRVIKRRLKDGVVTVLTPGGYASHTSTRNISRPGFAYVTYNYQGNTWLPYRDEIVAVPLDGSMAVQRFAHLHAQALDYLGESQGVPSPDGRRVVFASDWGAGLRPIRAYVIDTAPLCGP